MLESLRPISACTFPLAGILPLLLALAGCGMGYAGSAQDMHYRYAVGDINGALRITDQQTGSIHASLHEMDRLIWRLEHASLLRAAGRIEASEAAFDAVDALIETFDEQPEVRISAEMAATLTNLAALPYRGYAYDRIMVSTYRALNALALGDEDSARVALNRAVHRQRAAVMRNQQRIALAEDEARQVRAMGMAPGEHAQATALAQLTQHDLRFDDLYRAQGQYVNPFTELLQGIYFVHAGTSSTDLERGYHAFQRVTAMTGEHNPFAFEDLQYAQDLLDGRAVPAMTYVIFETGMAPSREQVKIDIPLPIRGIDYVGAAFPILVFHYDHERQLRIQQAGNVLDTRLVADMDTIIGLEFNNELPGVILRTIMIAAAQAAAHYSMHDALRDDEWANVLVRVLGGVYRFMQAQADRRSWRTLPKQFQYARFITPRDRVISLRTASGIEVPVRIDPGEVNVVYVKSIREGSPLQISQFRVR